MGGGSADKASKVKSLLASYYDLGPDAGNSLYDTPRCGSPGSCWREDWLGGLASHCPWPCFCLLAHA